MAMDAQTDPMDVLRTVVSAQGVAKSLTKPTLDEAIVLTAIFPTIVGAKRDQGAIAPHGVGGVPSGHATPRSNQEVPGASVTEAETAVRSEEVRGDRSRIRSRAE